MSFDVEKFSKLTAGMQSVITTIGLIVGGAWVAYTFWALSSINKSRAEVTALEQAASAQPVIQMTISSITNSGLPRVKSPRINISVRIENIGRAFQYTPLRLTAKLMMPQKLQPSPSVSDPINAVARILTPDGRLIQSPQRRLRNGQFRTVVYSVPVRQPGMYLVQIDTRLFQMELENGDFRPAKGIPVDAFEQALVNRGPVEKC